MLRSNFTTNLAPNGTNLSEIILPQALDRQGSGISVEEIYLIVPQLVITDLSFILISSLQNMPTSLLLIRYFSI